MELRRLRNDMLLVYSVCSLVYVNGNVEIKCVFHIEESTTSAQ